MASGSSEDRQDRVKCEQEIIEIIDDEKASFSGLETFLEITSCNNREEAANIMEAATGDLERAIQIFYSRQEAGSFMKVPPVSDEDNLARTIAESVKDHQSKEPDTETMLQILLSNLPHKDPEALRKLCEEYQGRSVELEQFLRDHESEIPPKLDSARIELETQITELRNAGVEEAEQMVVESCPSCLTPRIIDNPSISVFLCTSSKCGRESCRNCWEIQHVPEPCGKKKKKISAENILLKEEFKTVRMEPQRHFDEEDDLAIQYRIAESQFARMQKQYNLKYKITSIDVVYNAGLRTTFELRKKELKDKGCGDSLLLFHGTPQSNIESILRNNFDLSKRSNGRTYGDGVYFSEMPEVSLGYTKDQRSLILCQVLPGDNSKEVPSGSNDARCWAIVVPRVDQILPDSL